jgi:hypothetical protein
MPPNFSCLEGVEHKADFKGIRNRCLKSKVTHQSKFLLVQLGFGGSVDESVCLVVSDDVHKDLELSIESGLFPERKPSLLKARHATYIRRKQGYQRFGQ